METETVPPHVTVVIFHRAGIGRVYMPALMKWNEKDGCFDSTILARASGKDRATKFAQECARKLGLEYREVK